MGLACTCAWKGSLWNVGYSVDIPAGRSVMTELVAVSLRAAALAPSTWFMHSLPADASVRPMPGRTTQHHAMTGAGCLLQPHLPAQKARKL